MAATGRGRVKTEPGRKRIRVYLGGELVADTSDVLLVWETPYYPTYYFPAADVAVDLLVDTGATHRTPSRGEARVYTVKAGATEAAGAARWYSASPISEIAGHVAFDWRAMDAWFEEDDQVYVHARDPYKRIDILSSSRHVEIVVDGTTVADTRRPLLLFETGLPVRYYLPKADVRLDLLEPSATMTECPYKGTAGYYSVVIDGRRHDDLVWWYRHPVPESARIAGYVAFYDERVDVYVDGVLQDRPRTIFSRSGNP